MPLRFVPLVLLVMISPSAGQQVCRTPSIGGLEGFDPIFNGRTLDGWEGDPAYWRVENGGLVGEVTPERGRTFLALRGDIRRADAGGKARIIGSVGDKDALAAVIKKAGLERGPSHCHGKHDDSHGERPRHERGGG